MKEHPFGLVWLVLFFAAMMTLQAIDFGPGFLLNAAILRLALGWPWGEIRAADACPGSA